MTWRRTGRGLTAFLAVFCTLMTGFPAADVPVRVYDSAAGLAGIFGVLAVEFSWGYLALSRRRRRDFAAVFVLNLLAALFLCRTLWDVLACYTYYVTG